jgi:hypothetical protein
MIIISWGILWFPRSGVLFERDGGEGLPLNPGIFQSGAFYIKLLLGRFLGADNSDFYLLPALGAGNVEGKRLAHYPFGDRRYYGIDVVQTLVQHIDTLNDSFDF